MPIRLLVFECLGRAFLPATPREAPPRRESSARAGRRGDVNRFLTPLAVEQNVAAATQNQALAALLFLYEQVLEQPLNRIEGVVRARKPSRLPAVLTRDEVAAVLEQLSGVPRLVCTLLYGSGLRLLEGLRLRVKDVDFGRSEITVRDGKGQKDRVTMLPNAVQQPLRDHLRAVCEQQEADLKLGLGRAPLPDALARKYPNADAEWAWQWVFPASSHYLDSESGIRHRHHLHESVIQRAVHEAAPGWSGQGCGKPHFSPFVRNPSARRRLRHPDGAGAIGP